MRFRQKTKDAVLGQAVKRRGRFLPQDCSPQPSWLARRLLTIAAIFLMTVQSTILKKASPTKKPCAKPLVSVKRSVLNNGTFYYIHSRFVTESYRASEEVDRKVLAIYFDENKIVRDLAVYRLEDGIIVPIVARTTQTQGSELTALQQIFGNIGRFGDGSPTQF